ncbi:hypothetical protein D9757_000889 [Collybiopsis confluens]|uniref:Uncharacterized protein n=1 Tax=Collybiopsis confluens TaxID=2823264 RepID=A0A8H5MGD5_9AGAR|nr:hypothetical protein D9757_000889 [Collybiopsis confluens]
MTPSTYHLAPHLDLFVVGTRKVKLLELGAYKNMDICLMCHPAPGPKGSASLSSCLAVQRISAEYSGHPQVIPFLHYPTPDNFFLYPQSPRSAFTLGRQILHVPGQNALDAAVITYNNISALRQQLRPDVRVHGIIDGKNWAANVIPDNVEAHNACLDISKALSATAVRVLLDDEFFEEVG